MPSWVADVYLKTTSAPLKGTTIIWSWSSCDNVPVILDQHEHLYDVKWCVPLVDLLGESDCDLATICTPSGLHPQMVISVARAGKHVMTGKLMATRW